MKVAPAMGRSKDVFTMMCIPRTGPRPPGLNSGWQRGLKERAMTTMHLVITIIILAILATAASAATHRYGKKVQKAAPPTITAIAASPA
jgi:hypothetical protein